tara:strand:+ start:1500 stop:1793 length:294 start_codon:yes stop_codon:yes gene_type:complete
MTDIPPITVGHLKEIWKQHNVSDDDTIAFYFTTKEYDPITDKYGETIEIEFDQLYKREFGILMDFVPAELEEDEEEYPEPTDQEMMAAFGTKWHDGL